MPPEEVVMKAMLLLSFAFAAGLAQAAPSGDCAVALADAGLSPYETAIALGPAGTRAQYPANEQRIQHKLESHAPWLLPMRGLRSRCGEREAVVRAVPMKGADLASRH